MADSIDPHEAPKDRSPNQVHDANSTDLVHDPNSANQVHDPNITNQVHDPNGTENAPEVNRISELAEQKPQLVYRCKKCRRIVAGKENVVNHEQGDTEPDYIRRKRHALKPLRECATIFVEPMKWMQTVEEGYVAEKLYCMGCNTRIGSFNWAGMQCTCGVWVNPAFQLHKTRIDECPL